MKIYIEDYCTILADDWGNVSIGYTTENPDDSAIILLDEEKLKSIIDMWIMAQNRSG